MLYEHKKKTDFTKNYFIKLRLCKLLLFFNFVINREYLQRERVKYKNLLANAQSDLSTTKSFIEKEQETKSKHDTSHQQLTEENRKLIAM